MQQCQDIVSLWHDEAVQCNSILEQSRDARVLVADKFRTEFRRQCI